MKTISILGSGWLGLPLSKHFVQLGYEVKTSTRSIKRQVEIKAANAQPFIVDIDNQGNNIKEFLDSGILIVNITSKNIEGFKNLINEVEKSPINKVVFVSSTSVYKNTNKLVSEADGAENQQSPLLQIENLFRHNPCFQTTIIRFAGLFGYSRHPGRFFGERCIPQPDAPVNLIHRDDCINIIDLIVKQNIWGEVLNACADTHPSKREFYSYARSKLGMAAPEMSESSQADFKIINNQKVKRVLGYEFLHADLMSCFDL